ncbi:MAG: hypothetical protein JWO58_1548 [Chitinophagaceae bacterium]|nr:hypothetical protein [Chitinophagaceae bacterium]
MGGDKDEQKKITKKCDSILDFSIYPHTKILECQGLKKSLLNTIIYLNSTIKLYSIHIKTQVFLM